MYLNKYLAVRCPREIYIRFKDFCEKKPEIENISHGVRIAMIKYMNENK